MKKELLIFISIILLFSCEKEENINPEFTITGIWRVLNLTVTHEFGYIDPVSLNKIVTSGDTTDLTGTPTGDEYFQFYNDGVFSKFYYSNDSLVTVTHYIYDLNETTNDTIYWGSSDANIKYIITTLNLNNLHINTDYTFISQNGNVTEFERRRNHRQLIRANFP